MLIARMNDQAVTKEIIEEWNHLIERLFKD